jgi:hypothetical protein
MNFNLKHPATLKNITLHRKRMIKLTSTNIENAMDDYLLPIRNGLLSTLQCMCKRHIT